MRHRLVQQQQLEHDGGRDDKVVGLHDLRNEVVQRQGGTQHAATHERRVASHVGARYGL